MTEHGTPLPNEMIVLGSMGSGLTFCFVPVVDKADSKTVTRMIVAPVVADTIAVVADSVATAPRLGKPYLFDEETVDRNSVARSFVGLDVIKNWRDKGLVFNAKVTPRETAAVGTRDVWYWNTMGLQILYQANGSWNDPNFVTASQVQRHIINNRIVERFVYQYAEGRGIFMEPPRYNDFSENYEIDMYSRNKLTTFDCGVEMHGYVNMLREYIWYELPWEYRDYVVSPSWITMNYSYLWGNYYDDDPYAGWYPPSTGGSGSGSGHQPPAQTKICRVCDCGKADCPCASREVCIVPLISPVVKVPSSLLDVGMIYTISIEAVQDEPPTEKITSVEFIVNDGERDWYFDETNEGISAMKYMARVPGVFRFKALVYTETNPDIPMETEYTELVTQRFPMRNLVLNKFKADMEALWQKSLKMADWNYTYEYAAVMKIDTHEGAQTWQFLDYPSEPYTYGLLKYPAPFPSDSIITSNGTNPIDGGEWTIGLCHTHPAWEYADSPRPVGPSDEDNAPPYNIPAWVLDYYSEYVPGYSGSWVKNGTRATQFKPYPYGGDGREN